MKKFFCALAFTAAVWLPSAKAAVVSSDSFLTNGPLIGQSPQVGGAWALTNSTVNPISVVGGSVALVPNGQDVNSLFSTAVTVTAGTSIYSGFDLNLSAAQAGTATAPGDYFFHLSNSTSFYNRVYAQSSGAGFVLGLASGTTNTTTFLPLYGSTVLNFGTTYRVVTGTDFVAGASNDPTSLYVNPTDLITPGLNTAYLTTAWQSTAAEPTSILAVGLRQGGTTSAPTLSLDNLAISQTFSDVSATVSVPEPSSIILLGLASASFCAVRLRSRKMSSN